MTYKTLDTIPAKLFFKILKTGNYNLLSKKKEVSKEKSEKLAEIWQGLWCEYADRAQDQDRSERRIFEITKQIEEVKVKEKIISLLIVALEFDKLPDAMELMNKHGFRINLDTYFEDLERIKREYGSMQHQIKNLLRKMPKKQIKQGEEEKPENIDKLIIGYCAGIGYSHDTNTLTMSEFLSLQEIFKEKLKALTKNDDNKKGDNHRRRA